MLKLLLVDDDAIDRMIVLRALRSADLDVTCREAGTYAAALEAVREEKFDCIFIDYLLPDGDGLSLVRQLRTLGIATPLVALTGQGDEQTAVQLMKAGAVDYLTKATISSAVLTQVLINTQRIYEAEQAAQRAYGHLAESEERYRLVIKGTNDGIWDWDVKRNRFHVNDRLLMILGLAQVDLERAPHQLYSLVHPDDRPLIQQALRQKKDYSLELRLRHAQGNYRYCLCRGMSQFDNRGALDRMTGILSDISERKWFESEREHLLTCERQARQEAETANRLKDEFLATVSHELRTPLNAILGWTQLLQRKKLAGAAAERALETIERNARTQNRLIEDLLDVSQVITGNMRLEAKPITLTTVIEQALEVVRPTAVTKGIHLTVRIECADLVLGDAHRLQQVLWNLLANAIKFTPEGGQVSVMLYKEHTQAVLAVQDSGQGITPEFLPQVFERFRQADSTSTRQYGGLGLGLAIVRHLVELHGGTVEVASPGLGLGTTFRVKLPLHE